MHVRRIALPLTLLAVLAAGCSGGGHDDSASPKRASQPTANCNDPDLPQAEWTKHCASPSTKPPEPSKPAQSTHLGFKDTYTWKDGLKVTVTGAKVFTDYDPDLESASPGYTDFRVTMTVANGGKASVDLSDLSVLVEGATNGGEAEFTTFDRGSQPLEGRMAPGVTATKNADESLETKYGRRVVVTVQRLSDVFGETPEFSGTITG